MNDPSLGFVHPVANLSRVDRWSVYYRLQELEINCYCAGDGSLQVEIANSLHAILLRSVIYQWTAPKPDLLDWLDRCWNAL